MRTALFIQSYPGGNDTLARHWPYLKKSGMELFGVGREGGGCVWPEPVIVRNIGRDGYIAGGALPERLVETFRWFLTDPMFKEFTHACVVEYDSIFIGPPFEQAIGASAHLAGHYSPPMKALHFWHNPWWLNRDLAQLFVNKADELLARGERENGHPDFFFGLVFQELGVSLTHLPGTFSRNTMENPADQQMVRDRIARGECWFVHGCKTAAQLRAVLP